MNPTPSPRPSGPRSVLPAQLLARVRALQRRSVRQSQSLFWVEGVRSIVHASDAGIGFDTLVESPILLQSSLAQKIVRKKAAAGVPRVRLTPEQFRMISVSERASGVGAILKQRWKPLDAAVPDAGLCWLVIETLRSPGNLGTILRTAEACSVSGVIFTTPHCDPFDPNVVRASMAGIMHLNLIRTTPALLARWALRHNVRLVATSPRATMNWSDLPDNRQPTAFLIGEERQGLSAGLFSLAHAAVRLPMTGRADSLNVSVATGVLLYEMVRRKPQAR